MANVKISGLTTAGSLTGTEVAPIVQSGSTVKVTTQNIANLAVPYTSYVAYIVLFDFTTDPLVTVIYNNTSRTFNWLATPGGPGAYQSTLASAITFNKTYISITQYNNSTGDTRNISPNIDISTPSAPIIQVQNTIGNPFDIYIEIRFYN